MSKWMAKEALYAASNVECKAFTDYETSTILLLTSIAESLLTLAKDENND
jgi:hypothetical protein